MARCVLSKSMKVFFEVIFETEGDVNIYYAENYRLVVTTDSNIQDIITTRVNGNNLYIGANLEKINGFSPTKLIIDVYMPELKNIDLKGVGNINAQNLEAENVAVTISGSGDIRIVDGKTSDLKVKLSGVGNFIAQNFEAENVVVDLSGSGDIQILNGKTSDFGIKLSGVGNIIVQNAGNVVVTNSGSGDIQILNGKTSYFEIKLSGVGNIIAQNYEAENVVVDLSGSGDIKTWVTKSLTGKISGVGNVLYKGNPAINNVNITGSGNVRTL